MSALCQKQTFRAQKSLGGFGDLPPSQLARSPLPVRGSARIRHWAGGGRTMYIGHEDQPG